MLCIFDGVVYDISQRFRCPFEVEYSKSIGMLAAAVVTAGVPTLAVRMVMVVTVNIGIIVQTSAEQCAHRRVSVPADTAVELDACFGQSCLRTAADASADQSVYTVLHQEACQCAVTAAVGVNDFRMRDFASAAS